MSNNPSKLDELITSHPQITFMVKQTNRHTNVVVRRCKYEFNDRGYVVIPNIDNYNLIYRAMMSNWTNVKRLFLLVVDENYNCDDLSQLSLNGLTDTNVTILDSFTQPMLRFYFNLNCPKTFASSASLPKFATVQSHSMTLVPKFFFNSGKRLVYFIERYDNTIGSNLHLTYIIADDVKETPLLINTYRRTFISRYTTNGYTVIPGETSITIPYINVPIAAIALTTNKDQDATFKIKIHYSYWSKLNKCLVSVTEDIMESNDDPESYIYSDPDRLLYVFSAGLSLSQNIGSQNCGHVAMKNNSKIIIESDKAAHFDIMFHTFNMVDYNDKKVNFTFGLDPTYSESESNTMFNSYEKKQDDFKFSQKTEKFIKKLVDDVDNSVGDFIAGIDKDKSSSHPESDDESVDSVDSFDSIKSDGLSEVIFSETDEIDKPVKKIKNDHFDMEMGVDDDDIFVVNDNADVDEESYTEPQFHIMTGEAYNDISSYDKGEMMFTGSYPQLQNKIYMGFDASTFAKLNRDILERLVNAEEEKMVKERILPDNSLCTMTINNIKEGDYYYECSQCLSLFSRMKFREYVLECSRCPHCGTSIDIYPQLYINR